MAFVEHLIAEYLPGFLPGALVSRDLMNAMLLVKSPFTDVSLFKCGHFDASVWIRLTKYELVAKRARILARIASMNSVNNLIKLMRLCPELIELWLSDVTTIFLAFLQGGRHDIVEYLLNNYPFKEVYPDLLHMEFLKYLNNSDTQRKIAFKFGMLMAENHQKSCSKYMKTVAMIVPDRIPEINARYEASHEIMKHAGRPHHLIWTITPGLPLSVYQWLSQVYPEMLVWFVEDYNFRCSCYGRYSDHMHLEFYRPDTCGAKALTWFLDWITTHMSAGEVWGSFHERMVTIYYNLAYEVKDIALMQLCTTMVQCNPNPCSGQSFLSSVFVDKQTLRWLTGFNFSLASLIANRALTPNSECLQNAENFEEWRALMRSLNIPLRICKVPLESMKKIYSFMGVRLVDMKRKCNVELVSTLTKHPSVIVRNYTRVPMISSLQTNFDINKVFQAAILVGNRHVIEDCRKYLDDRLAQISAAVPRKARESLRVIALHALAADNMAIVEWVDGYVKLDTRFYTMALEFAITEQNRPMLRIISTKEDMTDDVMVKVLIRIFEYSRKQHMINSLSHTIYPLFRAHLRKSLLDRGFYESYEYLYQNDTHPENNLHMSVRTLFGISHLNYAGMLM